MRSIVLQPCCVTPVSALQPIEGRVVMLQSGSNDSTSIYGDDLQELSSAAREVMKQLKRFLVNSKTVNPDIVLGKPYIEFSGREDLHVTDDTSDGESRIETA